MAAKAGLTVKGGGKELEDLTIDGKYVTSIPHTLNGKGTAKAIAEAIIGAAQ